MLFALGILLTWSRSGIGTFFVFLFGILIVRVLKISHHHFRVRTIILPLLCFWFLLGVFFLFSDSILFFLNRLIYMKSDASALGRLTSFMWGWDLFLEHPILGVGYNYLALYLQDFSGFSSVDSSILATFITFGLIVSFLFLFWVAVWSICIFRRIKIIERDHSQISSFFRLIYFYVIICFVFTCHFNNLLYYQFWFIPVTVIFSYLSCCIQKIEDLKSKPWKSLKQR
ncbi:MAG: O-antigen ligase family protein [Chlamydiota bacterium]